MPEIRRLSASESVYSCLKNEDGTWNLAATKCRDHILGLNYGDAVKFLPYNATTKAQAVTALTAITLSTDKYLRIFLISDGASKETWFSQKTFAQMQAITGISIQKWTYAYAPENDVFYRCLGRPSCEGLALQLMGVMKDDATIAGLVTTFRHEEFFDLRMQRGLCPLLLFVPSSERISTGDTTGSVAVIMEVLFALYQPITGDHAAMSDVERRVRERIIDIVFFENPRLQGYLSDKTPPPDAIPDAMDKQIEALRGELFRRMVVPFRVADKLMLDANQRIY